MIFIYLFIYLFIYGWDEGDEAIRSRVVVRLVLKRGVITYMGKESEKE